jgi:AraC family transcriptional regulator, regulatory protein of adaptative response / methylated-DNA-[protein]-cysteine methyltransferase
MTHEHTDAGHDYDTVKRTLAFISERCRDQPSLEIISEEVGLSPFHLQRVFTRWAGLSPKAFLQALTLDHAKFLLRESASVLDATYESGLSSPGRLHDLFVTHEGMPPGVYKSKGQGLKISYGYHECPFGRALVMITDMGLCGLGFADTGEESRVLADMRARWPAASFREEPQATESYARRIFDPTVWSVERPLRIVFLGTDFEIRVWQTLLRIPLGKVTTYSNIAQSVGSPKAAPTARAAVGRNPISFVVPCHRVIGKSGGLTGYHWGLTRKRAILGWETGLAA